MKVPAPAAKSWSDYKPLYWSKNVRDRYRDRAMRLSFSTSWILMGLHGDLMEFNGIRQDFVVI